MPLVYVLDIALEDVSLPKFPAILRERATDEEIARIDAPALV